MSKVSQHEASTNASHYIRHVVPLCRPHLASADLLEAEQGAAARRAADELGLGDAHARRLQTRCAHARLGHALSAAPK